MEDSGNQAGAVISGEPSQFGKMLIDLRSSNRASQPKDADPAILESVRDLENSMTPTGMASLGAVTGADMEKLALLDPLTELYNSKAFLRELKNAIKRGHRYGRPVTISVVSVDGYQDIISRLGHLTGDAVLKIVANVIAGAIADTDIASRYSADQFAVIYPDKTSAAAAILCNKIRERIGTQAVSHNWQNLRITASVGLASFPEHGLVHDELVAKALQVLNFAKLRGGDRLCVF